MAKTRDDLLALAKRRYTECQGFRLQSLTEYELSQLQSLWQDRYSKTKKLDPRMRRELITVCLVGDDGSRLFKTEEADLLAELDAKVTELLYRACREHNGMDEDGDTEGIEKNSDETQD